jgi:tRNA threonylcarbamoyl adenosine modification protein (Sua5/YciO/YrdC/YwlC family)
MSPRVVPASAANWGVAAECIARGDLVVFPTDTVYGVGCDPYNVEALDHVYIAKGRPQQKAIPLLLSDPQVLERVASNVGPAVRALAASFWPGALTLVVPRSRDLPVQVGTGETIAVRVPAHDGLRLLLRKCGGALAATSANLSGEPDAQDVLQAAGYLVDHVSLYVDGGPSPGGRPSAVVDCTGESLRILREGEITAQQLREAVDRGR